MSPQSWRNCSHVYRQVQSFWSLYGLRSSLPIPLTHIISLLGGEDKAHSTIRAYNSVVSSFRKARGLIDPIRLYLVSCLTEGVERDNLFNYIGLSI